MYYIIASLVVSAFIGGSAFVTTHPEVVERVYSHNNVEVQATSTDSMVSTSSPQATTTSHVNNETNLETSGSFDINL